MITEIRVCSRRMAEDFLPRDLDRVISILDPGERAKLNADESKILRLEFEDVDDTNDPHYSPMKPEDAKKIIEFFEDLNGIFDSAAYHLTIHCYAGLSRSLSTAMALCDRFNLPREKIKWLKQSGTGQHNQWEDDYIFLRDSEKQLIPIPNAPPNKLVYKLVLGSP